MLPLNRPLTVQMREDVSLFQLLLGAQSNELNEQRRVLHRLFSRGFTSQDTPYALEVEVVGVVCSLKGIPADANQGCINLQK